MAKYYFNTHYTLGAAFGFWPNSDSAEFGRIRSFWNWSIYVWIIALLGLKFISKRIFGHNILQSIYIFFFFFMNSPSREPSYLLLYVEWQDGKLKFVEATPPVRGEATLCVCAWRQPCAICSSRSSFSLIRSDGSCESYYINKSLYDMHDSYAKK